MKPGWCICYEREYFGNSGFNHCGNHKEINGVDYCPLGGIFKDYGGMVCGNSIPPYEQTTLCEVKRNDHI